MLLIMIDISRTTPSIAPAFVLEPSFPCTGAKSAAQRGALYSECYGAVRCGSEDRRLWTDIGVFLSKFRASQGGFHSFIAEFRPDTSLTESEFEDALWARLRGLHEIDAEVHDWDPSVGGDPDRPNFSFSLFGTAFFIIGLHPRSSRRSRRYPVPAIVFNLHEQFETLRASGKYERFRDTIRARDAAYCGSANPNLRNFGERSEARQYSGRAVEDDWKCPFAGAIKAETR